MSEATLILKNMRGGCATIDGTVHTLFRFSGRPPRHHQPSRPDDIVTAAREGLNELKRSDLISSDER